VFRVARFMFRRRWLLLRW